MRRSSHSETVHDEMALTRAITDSYIPPSPGDIEDVDGKVLGRHEGLWKYTVGEGARLSGLPQKMFVARKDVERNVVIVVPRP